MNTPKNPKNPSKERIADDMKAKADQTSRDVKAKTKEQLEAQESRAADTMDKVAEATGAAARELDQRGEATLSHYVSEISEGIGSLSNNLRHKNTDELIQEASRLARHNAGLFLLGSVAVGFGLSRIAKANRPEGEQAHWENYYGQQRSTSYGTEAESAAAARGTSSPTHASTSYLPEDKAGAQSPMKSTDTGAASSSVNKPSGGAGV